LGALSKPGNHLLRLAAAQPQAGLASLFDRPYARCKMGCREKLPDPSVIWYSLFVDMFEINEGLFFK
jgi:hypothetical protein